MCAATCNPWYLMLCSGCTWRRKPPPPACSRHLTRPPACSRHLTRRRRRPPAPQVTVCLDTADKDAPEGCGSLWAAVNGGELRRMFHLPLPDHPTKVRAGVCACFSAMRHRHVFVLCHILHALAHLYYVASSDQGGGHARSGRPRRASNATLAVLQLRFPSASSHVNTPTPGSLAMVKTIHRHQNLRHWIPPTLPARSRTSRTCC